MKKIILCLFILLTTGCTKKEELSMEEKYDSSYLETIPDNAKYYIDNLPDNKVILSLKEIEKYNQDIARKTSSIYNLNIQTLFKETILNYLNMSSLPPMPKYNNHQIITENTLNNILENQNLDAIPKEVTLKKALVIQRTNLRSFPTDISFYDDINTSNFDRIQQTALSVNTPLLVIHSSKDNKYFLVMTKTYIGGVKQEDIVLVNNKDYTYFIHNPDFIIITNSYLKISNTLLDMGVKLPYNKTREKGYEVVIPIKDKEGHLLKKRITIPKDQAHIGYLPYTKKNIYIMAFKYEGLPYSWGGKDFSVDCSSYVANIYKTFGFTFPRNTSEQNKSVGKIISLENKTNTEKLQTIKSYPANLLYEDGHVLIYLGMKNNKHYVINASGNLLKVAEEQLDTSYHLNRINKLVLIN